MSKIVMIGAGNLATHLAVNLQKAHHEILQVYSRTMTSASELADRLHCSSTNELEQVVTNAEIFIFSVKDDVLVSLVQALCPVRRHALFLHTAGSMSIDIFKPYACHYGVIYPMQTFSKRNPLDFSEIPTFIEGNNEQSLRQIKKLALSLSKNVYLLSTQQRKHLHLAAVFACNFVNHCYHLSANVLQKQGIPFNVMLPLIDETASKIHHLHPSEAQTGPAIRYDENVIANHLELLSDCPEVRKIYELLTFDIHRMAIYPHTT